MPATAATWTGPPNGRWNTFTNGMGPAPERSISARPLPPPVRGSPDWRRISSGWPRPPDSPPSFGPPPSHCWTTPPAGVPPRRSASWWRIPARWCGRRQWMLWDRCRPKSGSPGWGRPWRTRSVWCAPWPAGFWPGLPRRGFHAGNASSGPRPSASMKRYNSSMPTIRPAASTWGTSTGSSGTTTGLKPPTVRQWPWSRPSSPPI